MKKTILAVMLCVLTAAALCACTPPAATADTTPTAAATASAVTAPTADIASTPAATTASATAGVTENKLGSVTDAYVSGGANYIKIDYVDMYTGDEAIAKALADGSNVVDKDESGDYFIPNDYYIRNVNNTVRTFPLDPACTIRVLNHDDPSTTITVSFDEFRTRLIEEPLMHVKVVNGVVVSMTQQFLP